MVGRGRGLPSRLVMAVSSFSFPQERHQSHLPLFSPAAGSIVPELCWLPQEYLRHALCICENGVRNSLETQTFASGGHMKKDDGLSLRKLGSLRKVEEAFSWCQRGVARGGSVR